MRITPEQASAFHCPRWEELPKLLLYMDQVILVLEETLSLFVEEKENVVTSTMINNYVKMKILPPPVKKRYSRVHLAYLIMVCMLKQALGIAPVQQILPYGAPEEQVRATYDAFVCAHKSVSAIFAAEVRAAASPALLSEEPADSAVGRLILQSAVAASLFKLLTEKLIGLSAPERGAAEGAEVNKP